MQKIIVALLGSLLLMPAASFAQESIRTQPRFVDKFQTHASKPIWEAAAREARLIEPNLTQQTPAATGRGRGKRVLIGALLGAGAGFVVASVSPDCTVQGGYCGAYRLIGTGIGAGVGTVVGAFVK